MPINAITVPLPTLSEPSKIGRVKQTAKSQSLLENKKVIKLVNELNQIPTGPSDNNYDLQQIRSIGQSIAQYLHSLGRCFTELADFMPASLADLPGVTVPLAQPQYPRRPRRDDQPGADRTLACRRPNHLSHSQPTTEKIIERMEGGATEKDKGSNPGQQKWHELADFFVSFGFTVNQAGEEQLHTRVHHSQADKSEQWPGLAINQLLNWMLHQANLPLPTESETQFEAEMPTNLPALRPVSKKIPILKQSTSCVSKAKLPAPAPIPPRPGRLQAESPLRLSSPTVNNLTNHPTNYLSPQLTTYPLNNFLLVLYAVARLLPPRT